MRISGLSRAECSVRADGVGMTDFFAPAVTGRNVEMGHASFPAGTVVPWAAHEGDEYSFILSGEMVCETAEEGPVRFSAGDACFIPAGQRHSSRNEGTAEASVVWMLVEGE